MDQSGGNQFIYNEPQSATAPQVAQTQTPHVADSQAVQWEASEFIDHQKSASWFIPLALGAVAASGFMFLITRSILSSLVVLFGGVAFVVLARQKPRTISYMLNSSGITIGQKRYVFDDFRTFSIVQEGALYSVFLEPIKRFMPPLSIYFAPEDGERIFDILATHIPHQQRQADPVERLMRRIRF